MNNYEKIKQMSIEELATVFQHINICDVCKNEDCSQSCNDGIVKWLQAESEG